MNIKVDLDVYKRQAINNVDSEITKPLSHLKRNPENNMNTTKTPFALKHQKLQKSLSESMNEGKADSYFPDNVSFQTKQKQKIVQKRDNNSLRNNYTGATNSNSMQCRELYTKLFNLELMVTVDHKVMNLHLLGDIEAFILTVINMVSKCTLL